MDIRRHELNVQVSLNGKEYTAISGKFDMEDGYSDGTQATLLLDMTSEIGPDFREDDRYKDLIDLSIEERDKVLVVTTSSEWFESSIEFTIEVEKGTRIEDVFDVSKFKLHKIVTDDLAFGEDFGDYLYGFTYDKEEHSFEHAGSSDYDFSIEFC